MSYNSLTYFDLNLKTLTPLDKFIMKAFVNETNLTNLYQATDWAQQLKSQGQTYCYKYVPEQVGLYPKVYEQNELIDLTFISMFVSNPYTYDFSKPLYVNGRWITVDEVDRSFIIMRKGRQFYESLFAALEMAKEFRANGRYYCYNLNTPVWFPSDIQYNAVIPGQHLILLWFNKNYIINGPWQDVLDKYNKK
jgi:hypothetical protein